MIFCLKIKCISPSWLQKLHLETFGRVTELYIYCFNLSSLFSFPSFDVMNQFWRIKWHFLSNKEESLLVQTFIRGGKEHRSAFIYYILIAIQNVLQVKHIFTQYLTINRPERLQTDMIWDDSDSPTIWNVQLKIWPKTWRLSPLLMTGLEPDFLDC